MDNGTFVTTLKQFASYFLTRDSQEPQDPQVSQDPHDQFLQRTANNHNKLSHTIYNRAHEGIVYNSNFSYTH